MLVPFLLLGSLCAQEAGAPSEAQTPEQVLAEILANPALSDARFGVHVVDLEDGEELLNNDADKGFMTASNMKLMSSAVALHVLGPEFRFVTKVVAIDPIPEDQLEEGQLSLRGLVLVGDGDPTLGGRHEGDPMAPMHSLAAALKDKGVASCGQILLDKSCHADEVMGKGWQWDYQEAAYAAQISGLCFNENIVRVVLEQSGGELEMTSIVPSFVTRDLSGGVALTDVRRPFVELEGVYDLELLQSGSDQGTSLATGRTRGTNRLWVAGRLAPGERQVIRYAVERPDVFALLAFEEALFDAGLRARRDDPGGLGAEPDYPREIAEPGPRRPGRPLDRQMDSRDQVIDLDLVLKEDRFRMPDGSQLEPTVLAQFESPPVRDILVTLNKVSQNLYAEQMLRAAGRKFTGEQGSLQTGLKAVHAMLESFGVDFSRLQIEDGSGLTRRNQVHPRHFTGLLTGMWGHEHRDVFWQTLPIAGVDGTLGKRFQGTAAEGIVRAKTGYISRVVALSGYIPRPDADGDGFADGQPLVFSMLFNNFTCPTSEAKNAIDNLVVSLAESLGHKASPPTDK